MFPAHSNRLNLYEITLSDMVSSIGERRLLFLVRLAIELLRGGLQRLMELCSIIRVASKKQIPYHLNDGRELCLLKIMSASRMKSLNNTIR